MMELILVGVLAAETILLLLVLLNREHKHGPVRHSGSTETSATMPTPHLTPADLDRLNATAQQAFATAVDEGAKSFHADLESTSQQLNKLIVRITTDVVER
jgi:hypothetical protein